MAFHRGQEWPYFKWPYQAKVIKIFEQHSKTMVFIDFYATAGDLKEVFEVKPTLKPHAAETADIQKTLSWMEGCAVSASFDVCG